MLVEIMSAWVDPAGIDTNVGRLVDIGVGSIGAYLIASLVEQIEAGIAASARVSSCTDSTVLGTWIAGSRESVFEGRIDALLDALPCLQIKSIETTSTLCSIGSWVCPAGLA